MKTLANKTTLRSVFDIVLISALIVAVFCTPISMFIMFTVGGPLLHRIQTIKFITQHHSPLATILDEGITQAANCIPSTTDCRSQTGNFIYSQLQDLDQLKYPSSTYFIRARKQATIEKLFLSGEYQSEPVDTPAEHLVFLVLQDRLPGWVLAIGAKLDANNSTMHYLNDFHSEAEIIVPVKQHGKVIGALVRLYGD